MMISYFLNAPRSRKRTYAVIYDLISIPIAAYLAIALRYGDIFPDLPSETLTAILLTTAVSVPFFVRLGLYRAVVRFMTGRAFFTLGLGIAASALLFATFAFFTQASVPRSSLIIYLFTAYALLGSPRLVIRSLSNQAAKLKAEPVLIYGAGTQGIALENALRESETYRPFAFIDDDPAKAGITIHGLRVYKREQIAEVTQKFGTKKLLLALGRTGKAQRKAIVEQLADMPLEVLTAPSVTDVISGKATITEIKEVDIEDLLGREPVLPDVSLLHKDIFGKNVLVTGAGGSIGSELCRQILINNPRQLVLVELNEYSLYRIDQELNILKAQHQLSSKIIPILGSVQKQNRLENIFSAFDVNTIYHAAAYKHVPMVEHNVVEGVRNNVFGTWFCAEAAVKAGVGKFVLISTDKSVRPTNVMGASKRVAELVLQALATRQADTVFAMVRFGNVLGSSGSVVPLFRKQIKEGGPITVTHPDIIRYFMTIPEAAQLVIQAGAMATGGDVYVLDMGEPVRITDLARRMIHLSGLTEKTKEHPEGDIGIHFTGLRPGEKLYEELLVGDNVKETAHTRIMSAHENFIPWPETHNLLHRLDKACHEFRVDDVIDILLDAPAAYHQLGECSDWVFNAREGA